MSVRRKIWERRIKNFWEDFSHNRIGLVGLGIILIFVAVAFLTPILAPVDPEQRSVAEQYAYPEWYANLVPSLRNLPRSFGQALNWTLDEESVPTDANVTVEKVGTDWIIKYINGTEQVRILLYANWYYRWDPPKTVDFRFMYSAVPTLDARRRTTVEYSLELNLTTPTGNKTSPLWNDTYPLWDNYWWASGWFEQPYQYNQLRGMGTWPFSRRVEPNISVTVGPSHLYFRLGYPKQNYENMIRDFLGPPGNFTFKMYITIKPRFENATCEITLSKFNIRILGLVYGLLGTQVYGCDCWSRLIYGVRISLAVGLTAALIATSFGILVGVVAGYLGGAVDEILMRVVDVLICLPALPILMVLVALYGRNVYYIVLIIAVFGWQGLSRMIRSQTLSIREMAFIECATASGASNSYIMTRHVIPNILPIALADMVLSIPGAIILEAALSFIGFGDPSTPTWGREFNLAWSEGSGFSQFIWWWVVPPGIAITALCLAFVFISHAIDEIVNPRLRRRR